jgi:hypothetical protein
MPLGDSPHTTVAMACARCGVTTSVRIAADGQPQELDPAFVPARLLAWFGFARAAMASGAPGVAIGACSGCASPLVVSSRQEFSLPCPHCGEVVSGPAAQVVVDQWTEPWARVEGPSMQLEYRLAAVEDAAGLAAGCAACGAPTPVSDASTACATCGATAWVARGDGRMQLAVRIDGTRDDRPFGALVPIVQGERMLRGDAVRGASARSMASLLGATGIGCASALGALVLVALAVALAMRFGHC